MAIDNNLSQDRIDQIECQTWDLLVEAYNDYPIVPPIDLNRLVAMAGLQIKQGEFLNKDISGGYDKANRVIYINATESYARKAFTTAHELGHFYLHNAMPKEIFFRQCMQSLEGESRVIEQEANWFAASLLMPKPAITELWYLVRDIQELARRCGVSTLALHYRLKNLGLLKHD